MARQDPIIAINNSSGAEKPTKGGSIPSILTDIGRNK